MRSHSIKLASIQLSLCLSLFFFDSPSAMSAKHPGELFRSVGVTTLALFSSFPALSYFGMSHLGFPFKKEKFCSPTFSNNQLLSINVRDLIIPKANVIYKQNTTVSFPPSFPDEC